MKIFRSILGYLWAGLSLPIIVMTFMQMDLWEERLVTATGWKVSERWTGGEIIETIPHEGYQTAIHRPVFDGLFWERRTGFVQIDWQAAPTLPDTLTEEFDIEHDGQPDFQMTLNTITNDAQLTALQPKIKALTKDGVLVFAQSRSVRVQLQNQRRAK